MESENEIVKLVLQSFENLKKSFYKKYKVEEREEDTPIPILILRDIIESLPPTMQIIRVDGPETHEFLKNGCGYILNYDFTDNSKKCEYCRSVDATKPEQLTDLLVNRCGYSQKDIESYVNDLCSNFNIIGWEKEDLPKYLQFIPDNIIKDHLILDRKLEQTFLWQNSVSYLIKKYDRRMFPDFNKIFDIQNDPILLAEEYLKPSESSVMFGLNFNDVQKTMAEIQLIPIVPDPVKHAFKRTKELFIFGYFRYQFFTIAQHYAFLTLESAIKWCYAKFLGERAILRDQKNSNLSYQMKKPEYSKIHEFCKNNKTSGWNAKRLLVNDEDFPHNGKLLIVWLLKKGLIRKWEQDKYNAGMQLRNSYSHLESISITPPHSSLIQNVANQINQIYYNLDKISAS